MQPQSNESIFVKTKELLTRDPKRSSLMAGLALLMLFLWGRLLFNGPASATASLIRRSVAAMTDLQEPTAVVPSSNPTLDWLGQPKAPVDRNLFAIHLDYYAKASEHSGLSNQSDDPAKSSFDGADENREKQILLENLQTQAAKLKLQTTMLGTTPTAVVNGELVKAGDNLEGFTVVRIESRKIVVQQDGVVLEIAMP